MSYESPASVLYDITGTPMAVTGGVVVPVSTSAFLVAGVTSDGTGSFLRTEQDGTLHVTGSFTVTPTGVQTITGTVAIQGITNISGALPVYISNPLSITGAITANQGTAGTIGQSWFTQITNGTQVIGTGSSAPLFVQDAVHTGSIITAVARTTATVALVASASQTRRGVTIYNDVGAILYVLYGSGTIDQNTFYSIKLSAQSYLEVPDNFNGPIYGSWQSNGTGNALITQFFV